MGLSRHPVSCFGGESTCNCHETPTLRGWQGQDNFASAPFIHIFCLTHAKGRSSPWGSRAPAFPSGCLSSEPGPCCLPTAGLFLQPPSALAGFTASILGTLKRGLWWCWGRGGGGRPRNGAAGIGSLLAREKPDGG